VTRLSPAELRQLCIDNPDFAARNAEALKGLLRSPTIAETVGGERVCLSAPQDGAQVLFDYMRRHAPDIADWFIREYHFDRFRIDLADPQHMIAVEIDGGQFKPGGGKHGSKRDYEKINALTLAGWKVIRFRAIDMRADPLGTIDKIRQALA
jgi:very-short-patch-repair endonuclease